MIRHGVGVLATLLLVAGCSSTTGPGESAPSGGDPNNGKCIEVSAELEKDLAVDRAVAFKAAKDFANTPGAWYVSAENGATWITSIDPTAEEDRSGLTAALNDTARATTELGSEAMPPGFSDSDPGALRSRDCASG